MSHSIADELALDEYLDSLNPMQRSGIEDAMRAKFGDSGAFDRGYDDGLDDGKARGFESGYEEGLAEGKRRGRIEAESEAKAKNAKPDEPAA